MTFLIPIFGLILISNFLSHTAFAETGIQHDFRQKTWTQGRSCMVCHLLKGGLPTIFPPDSKLPDLNQLNPALKAALVSHPKNIVCFACHKVKEDGTGLDLSHAGGGGGLPASGSLAPGQQMGTPSFSSGTRASVCLRVNNRGAQSLDCLDCHDVHNMKTEHLLKDDYGKGPTTTP